MASRSPRSAVSGTRQGANLLTSLLLVFPLLIFYGVGVLFTDVMNGADFLTQNLLHLVGLRGYLGIQVALVALFLGLVLHLKQHQDFRIQMFIPVILESGVYALTMGTLIVFVMVDLLGIDPRLAAGGGDLARAGLLDRAVLAVGAGVHEELVFRLGLLTGLRVLGERALDLRRWLAILLAFLFSSVLFSAAHHLGPLGEPFRLGVFTYRSMAGLFFASLFQFRSFAIAVYTHALYDIYVIVLH